MGAHRIAAIPGGGVTAEGLARTPDLGGTATTEEVAGAVCCAMHEAAG